MKDQHQTRRDAVAGLLATINDIFDNPGKPSNLLIAQSTVDAIAAHAAAVAHSPETTTPGNQTDDL